MTMTPDLVRSRIADIAASAGDFEAAHGMEDDLRADVLNAIATWDIEDGIECARLAMTTSDIEFPRYCA